MKKVALHNLGCKVNAYETEAMQELLEKHGYEIVAIAGIMLGLRIIKTKKVLHLPEQAYASGETVRHIEKIRNMPSWRKEVRTDEDHR